MTRFWSLGAVMVLVIAACATPPDEAGSTEQPPTTATTGPTTTSPPWAPTAAPCAGPGEIVTDCPLPGYPDRPFDVAVPSGYDPAAPTPVLVILHGGGGNSSNAFSSACSEGALSAPNCFWTLGEGNGFITVYPNGSGNRLAPGVRTWNAGGDSPDYACVSGRACKEGVDDIAYLNTLLDELEAEFRLDLSRIYFTGFSNGAAMAHRVGCEMAGRVAAIAPVSGTNQFGATAGCSPARPVPVLQIHGTADPCWTYEESNQACLDQDPRPKLGVVPSTLTWVERNGCEAEAEGFTMPDLADDGMTTTVEVWTGCDGGGEVRLMAVEGGGHAFPSGDTGRARMVGRPTRDFGSEVVWEFLSRFSLGG